MEFPTPTQSPPPANSDEDSTHSDFHASVLFQPANDAPPIVSSHQFTFEHILSHSPKISSGNADAISDERSVEDIEMAKAMDDASKEFLVDSPIDPVAMPTPAASPIFANAEHLLETKHHQDQVAFANSVLAGSSGAAITGGADDADPFELQKAVDEIDATPAFSRHGSVSDSAPVSADVGEKLSSPVAEGSADEMSRVAVQDFDYTTILTDGRDVRLFQVMKISPARFFGHLFSPEEIALDRFLRTAPVLTPGHAEVVYFKMTEEVAISCVNWKGKWYVTGTDIVRLLVTRFELFTGRPPLNLKKFEEGIFSDLRRLSPPHDCILEGTRSDFLVFLFDHDCVRSKKKQKVFYWNKFQNVAHSIFCDAVDRELARIEMATAVGMTVEEFVKSGVVPTGTSSQNDPSRYQLPFDWTTRALEMEAGDRDGYLSVDQIHVIRNDIAHLFGRFLRNQLMDPARSCRLGEDATSTSFNSSVGRGHFIPPKPPAPPVDENDSNADFGDNSPRLPGAKRIVRRKPASKNTPPLTPRVRVPRASASISRRKSQTGGLFSRHHNDDEEDSYSASTMSSNEDEIRQHYKRRAPLPPPQEYPTYIEHGYDEEYYYNSNPSQYYGYQYHPSSPPMTPAHFSQHTPPQQGLSGPDAMSSPMSQPEVCPPSASGAYPSPMPPMIFSPAMQHQHSSAKRAAEDSPEIQSKKSNTSGSVPEFQPADGAVARSGNSGVYEAAYILLGISRHS